MKINPEMSSVINVVKQNSRQQRKAEETAQQQRIVDTISLENKQASNSRVQNVEEAKEVLAQVVVGMPGNTSQLHTMNLQRVINLIP